MEPMPPAHALGKSLEEFRQFLGITEAGDQESVDDRTVQWAFQQSGVTTKLVDGRVVAVFLYSDGYEGFKGYEGDTAGLRLNASKQIVRFKFGRPTRFREGATESVLGTYPVFDRYDYDSHSYHFQYDRTGTWLRMLTIMSPGEVRRIDAATAPRPNDTVVYDKAKYHADSVQELGLPDTQAAVHTAFFLGWLMENDLCSDEFTRSTRADIDAYKAREKSALDVYALWDHCLVDDMLSDEGNAFAQSYFEFSTGQYLDDYLQLLGRKLPSEFHVPYTWENQKKISHRIGSQYRRWKRKIENAGSRTTPATDAGRKTDPPVPTAKPKVRPRRVMARAKPTRPSGKLLWLFKFVVFPIAAVGTGLLILFLTQDL